MAVLQFKLGGVKVSVSSKGVRLGGSVGGLYVSKRVVEPAKKVRKCPR